ncbi:MAG TPA: hypothetical protein VNL96_01405 [Gemmatimonadaceae bacterium]|nr:hypothetical protein [Gemmatimonadaceae bacterium]
MTKLLDAVAQPSVSGTKIHQVEWPGPGLFRARPENGGDEAAVGATSDCPLIRQRARARVWQGQQLFDAS